MKTQIAQKGLDEARVLGEISDISEWRERAHEAANVVTALKLMLDGTSVRWPRGLENRVINLRKKWPRSNG